MGSTTLASFLSKLLKSDRKENSSSPRKVDVRKRHSAPVPSWFDVTNPAHIPPPASPSSSQSKSKRRQRGDTIEAIREDQTTVAKENIKKNNKKQQKQNNPKQNAQNVPLRKKNEALDIEGANKENRKKDKSSGSRKAARRHSTGLSYWFCVSGNADTLERGLNAPFPRDRKNRIEGEDKHRKPQDLSSIPEQGQSQDRGRSPGPSKPVSLAGVIRRDGKKKKGDAKNRHSAPPDTLAVYRPKDRPVTPSQCQGLLTHPEETVTPGRLGRMDVAPSPTRSMSPGVRYRVDGTLEKPYVFPSALTFGAEGRKTRLRSSSASPIQESPNQPDLNPSTPAVLAEVHEAVRMADIREAASRKDVQTRGYGSNPNIADVSYDDFDVRKAFYLKYDGCETQPAEAAPETPETDPRLYRHSMPVFPAAFDVMAVHQNVGVEVHQGLPAFAEDDIHQAQSPSGRQRYSMPPKNDEFVYMGSRENLNVWSEFVERQELERTGANCQGGRETEPRKRYSSPVQNPDYVYMGSIENIHLLNAEDKRAGCLSLKRDVDAFFLTGSGAMPAVPAGGGNSAMTNQDPGIHGSSASETETHVEPDRAASRHPSLQSDGGQGHEPHPLLKRNNELEEHHHSLPELSLPHERRLSRTATQSESNAVDKGFDVVVSDREDLSKDALENGPERFRRDPFARNLGRASCMPGNKRNFAPPPAVFSQSDSKVQLSGRKDVSGKLTTGMEKFTFMPGNRRFKLPPPPNYTPPREEMEDVQAQLAEMSACHKGSQTDLHDEALYCVDMEDRDLSLPRDTAKTMEPSTSSLADPTVCVAKTDLTITERDTPLTDVQNTTPAVVEKIQNAFETQSKSRRLLNVSTASSQGSDDVFKDGSASDTTWAADRFQLPRRGKYSLAGVRPNPNPTPVSYAPSNKVPQDSRETLVCRDSDIKHQTKENEPESKTLSLANFQTDIIKEQSANEETLSSFENNAKKDAVVTSTPKVVRREKPGVLADQASGSDSSSQTRPIPTPRKRYSALGLCGYAAGSVLSTILTSEQHVHSARISSTPEADQHVTGGNKQPSNVSNQHCPATAKSPPVPKKRRNLSRSQTGSDSCFSSPEDSGKTLTPKTHIKAGTQQNPVVENQGNRSTEQQKSKSENSINPESTPLATSTLRAKDRQGSSREDQSTGATHSTKTRPTRRGKGLSLDDTCIADDELSCFDDGHDVGGVKDSTMQRRRRSMRKCVSVDDLLRSGSILDRSVVFCFIYYIIIIIIIISSSSNSSSIVIITISIIVSIVTFTLTISIIVSIVTFILNISIPVPSAAAAAVAVACLSTFSTMTAMLTVVRTKVAIASFSLSFKTFTITTFNLSTTIKNKITENKRYIKFTIKGYYNYDTAISIDDNNRIIIHYKYLPDSLCGENRYCSSGRPYICTEIKSRGFGGNTFLNRT